MSADLGPDNVPVPTFDALRTAAVPGQAERAQEFGIDLGPAAPRFRAFFMRRRRRSGCLVYGRDDGVG
jgi:hypothetical protein